MSKGLEALKRIVKGYIDTDDIETISKELKALEIIKNRKVDIYLLEITKNVDQYNKPFCEHLVSLCRLLTQEEYDLLKGVVNET